MIKLHQISIDECIKKAEKQGTCALCEYSVRHTCFYAGKVKSCIGYKPIQNPCEHCMKESKCAENGYICDLKFFCADNVSKPKDPTNIPCASCSWQLICVDEGFLKEEGCFMYQCDTADAYTVVYQDKYGHKHTDLLGLFEEDLVKATKIFRQRIDEGYPLVQLVKDEYHPITKERKSTVIREYENTCFDCDQHCDQNMCYKA